MKVVCILNYIKGGKKQRSKGGQGYDGRMTVWTHLAKEGPQEVGIMYQKLLEVLKQQAISPSNKYRCQYCKNV